MCLLGLMAASYRGREFGAVACAQKRGPAATQRRPLDAGLRDGGIAIKVVLSLKNRKESSFGRAIVMEPAF